MGTSVWTYSSLVVRYDTSPPSVELHPCTISKSFDIASVTFLITNYFNFTRKKDFCFGKRSHLIKTCISTLTHDLTSTSPFDFKDFLHAQKPRIWKNIYIIYNAKKKWSNQLHVPDYNSTLSQYDRRTMSYEQRRKSCESADRIVSAAFKTATGNNFSYSKQVVDSAPESKDSLGTCKTLIGLVTAL